MTRIFKQRDVISPLDVLTISQGKILELLVRYRYMTIRQFVACGVAKNESVMYSSVLPRLTKRKEKNLLAKQSYAPTSVMNGMARTVYALSEYGAEAAADLLSVDASEIRYPKGGIQFAHDYLHREAYVDFCIALDKWVAEHDFRDLPHLTHEFDKLGSNRGGTSGPMKSVNRLTIPDSERHIIPDGMGLVVTDDGNRVAFAVEIHHTTDPKRVATKQLFQHAEASAARLVGHHFNHDRANLVLSVWINPAMMERGKAIMLRIPNFARYAHLFRFNDIETLKAKGFSAGWTLADGKEVEVFG